MSPVDLLTNGFARIPALMERAAGNLDARTLATAPSAGSNSIAWLIWHTARGQDEWVSDLNGTALVWATGTWCEDFALPFGADENGFGMTAADAARVVASAELLTGYLRAVTGKTLAYIATLSDTSLDDIVDEMRQPPVSRGVQLMSILDDGLQHAGQAGYARGMLDRSMTSPKVGASA